MMKHLKILIFIPIVFFCCISLSAQQAAITGGDIVTGTGEIIKSGTILLKDGRIEKVGKEIAIPEGYKVIEAAGKTIWPGRIDALSIIGLSEIGAVAVTNDANEKTSTNTAQLRAADGINPESSVIGVTRNNGITTTQVMQGRAAPINGLTAIIDLDGRRLDQMLIADGTAIVLNFNAMERGKYPSTRPGIMAFIRQSFFDIQNKLDKAEGKDADKNELNLKDQVLARVLKGEISVFAFCEEKPGYQECHNPGQGVFPENGPDPGQRLGQAGKHDQRERLSGTDNQHFLKSS